MFDDDEEEKDDMFLHPIREIKADQADIVVKITEKMEGVIEKATRKMRTEAQLIEAKR